MTMLVNFVLFQIGWFACVLGAAHGMPSLGVAVATAVVAYHLLRASRARPELVLILVAAAIGFIVDSALVTIA